MSFLWHSCTRAWSDVKEGHGKKKKNPCHSSNERVAGEGNEKDQNGQNLRGRNPIRLNFDGGEADVALPKWAGPTDELVVGRMVNSESKFMPSHSNWVNRPVQLVRSQKYSDWHDANALTLETLNSRSLNNVLPSCHVGLQLLWLLAFNTGCMRGRHPYVPDTDHTSGPTDRPTTQSSILSCFSSKFQIMEPNFHTNMKHQSNYRRDWTVEENTQMIHMQYKFVEYCSISNGSTMEGLGPLMKRTHVNKDDDNVVENFLTTTKQWWMPNRVSFWVNAWCVTVCMHKGYTCCPCHLLSS